MTTSYVDAYLGQLSALSAPPPLVTSTSTPFWDAAQAGSFILQRCAACNSHIFYPREQCPHCWSRALNWTEASGSGHVRSHSLVSRAGNAAWSAVAPYRIGIVELQEGPTLLTQILSSEDHTVTAGDPCQVRFVKVGKWSLPFFEIQK
ncbi:Zn-ribbon domain-containing OB-fold protein [Rhodococcus koreensis]